MGFLRGAGNFLLGALLFVSIVLLSIVFSFNEYLHPEIYNETISQINVTPVLQNVIETNISGISLGISHSEIKGLLQGKIAGVVEYINGDSDYLDLKLIVPINYMNKSYNQEIDLMSLDGVGEKIRTARESVRNYYNLMYILIACSVALVLLTLLINRNDIINSSKIIGVSFVLAGVVACIIYFVGDVLIGSFASNIKVVQSAYSILGIFMSKLFSTILIYGISEVLIGMVGIGIYLFKRKKR